MMVLVTLLLVLGMAVSVGKAEYLVACGAQCWKTGKVCPKGMNWASCSAQCADYCLRRNNYYVTIPHRRHHHHHGAPAPAPILNRKIVVGGN